MSAKVFLICHSKSISEFKPNTEVSSQYIKLIMSCNISPYVCTTKNLYYILLKILNTHTLQSSVLITDMGSKWWVLNDDAYHMKHTIAHLSRDLAKYLYFDIGYNFSCYLLLKMCYILKK